MSSQTGISITSPDIDHAIRELSARGWDKAALPTMRNLVRRTVNTVRKNVRAQAAPHRKTGKMRNSVRTRFAAQSSGWRFYGSMRVTGAVANLIVGGVVPHRITAGGAVMPMWTGAGKWKRGEGRGIIGFARAVEHPGFAADPFVDRGIDESRPAIQGYMDDAVKTMAKELAYRLERR
jgi:hypothetical protein